MWPRKIVIFSLLTSLDFASVAKQIVQHLSKNSPVSRPQSSSKYNPIFEFNNEDGDRMVVSSVSGHILSHVLPQQYKSWWNVNPRIILDRAEIVSLPTPQTASCVKNIQNLARFCDTLVLWLDCDREGAYAAFHVFQENIAYEVIKVCTEANPRLKDIKRARFAAVTERDVINAFRNLGLPNKNESEAVEYRKEIDFRLGCAFTRFQTVAYRRSIDYNKKQPISYGPCQFPTLNFVVERELQVRNFKPQKFWVITCAFESPEKTKVDFKWERGKIFDQTIANLLFVNMFESFQNKKPIAKCFTKQSEPRKKFKPYPLATIPLQKLATQTLKMSSARVMEVAEKLYQNGYISYPRTETTSFPDTMNLRNILVEFINNQAFGPYVSKLINENQYHAPRKGAKSDEAHPPIYPVKSAKRTELTPEQWNIYDLVCRHFFACCSRDAEGEEVKVEVAVAEQKFSSNYLKIVNRGYLEIYDKFGSWVEKQLPTVPENFEPILQLNESQTTPPKYLTETELISLMDKNGIGTDATLQQHIQTIQTRNFAKKTGQTFRSTPIGMALIKTYRDMRIDITGCDLRRTMEETMNQIAGNRIGRVQAVKRTQDFIIPVYQKLAAEEKKWVQVMKEYLNKEDPNFLNPIPTSPREVQSNRSSAGDDSRTNSYSNNSNSSNSSNSTTRTVTCYKCGEQGHIAPQCKRKPQKSSSVITARKNASSSATEQKKPKRKGKPCAVCGKVRHNRGDTCPGKKQGKKKNSNDESESQVEQDND